MQIYDNNEIPAGYQQKSRMIYIILAIFLYQFGAHEFYRGNAQSATGYLVCSVVAMIWFFAGLANGLIYYFPVILQFIIFILMIIAIIKTDRDANGVLMK